MVALDASVLLGLLFRAEGHPRVAAVLPEARLSAALRLRTDALGLSLGDRAWQNIEVGVQVLPIR